MGLPPDKMPSPPPRKRKRWIKRALMVAAALVVAAVAAPFVFTGPIVRRWLVRSPLRDLPLQFESARLSPFGRLTLYNVTLGDSGEQKGNKLATAQRMEISFRWADLPAGRLERISLDQFDLTLRPGRDTPITLARLFSAGPTETPASAAPQTLPAQPPTPASAQSPWVEQVWISGVVRFEGYGTALSPYGIRDATTVPVQLAANAVGNPGSWSGTLSLAAGDAGGTLPRVALRLSGGAASGDTTLKLESLAIENATGAWSGKDALLQSLPQWARDNASATIESMNLAGSVRLGRGQAIDATIELRDLQARAIVAGKPLALNHFAAGLHLEGFLSDRPFEDLAFNRMRASWDGLQVEAWKFGKGVAEFNVEGTEIEATHLQTTTENAEVVATAAFDTATGLVSRGVLVINNIAAPTLIARLPESIQGAIPWTVSGNLSLRATISESNPFQLAGRVQIVCPDQLLAYPAKPANAAPQPVAVVTNFDLAGTIHYARQAERWDLERGRLTADQLLVASPRGIDPGKGLTLNRIKSDFTLSPARAVLSDFYADLPGNGRLIIEGQHAFDGGASRGTLTLNGIDAAMANPWLPAGWTIAGQVDASVQVGISPRTMECGLSFGLAPQTVLKGPDGILTLTGGPTASAHAMLERSQGVWSVDVAQISNVTAFQADASMAKMLRERLQSLSGMPAALHNLEAGGGICFDKISLTGNLSGSGDFAGNLAINGLDADLSADKPLLQNLTFRAGVAMPSTLDWLAMRVTNGQLLAEKIVLGGSPLTEVDASLSIDQKKLVVKKLAFSAVEGTLEGDVAMTLPAQLDTLHLNFTNISQQILTNSLYPDKFTAEGPASGNLTLVRGSTGLAGTGQLMLDKPGRLRISPETTKKVFEQKILDGIKSQIGLLPDNIEDIIVAQLSDYSYESGNVAAEISAADGGQVALTLKYLRTPLKPGEPGSEVPINIEGQQVKAKLQLQLTGITPVIRMPLEEILRNTAVLKNWLNSAGKQNP